MSLDRSRIQALCFDIDGTLRDTDDQYVARLARLLQVFRILLPQRDAHRAARRILMRLETPANLLYGLSDRLGIDGRLAALGNRFSRHRPPGNLRNASVVPGAQNSLTQLAEHYPMAIVSARGQRGTVGFLEQFDLDGFFHCVASAQTCQRTKPHPAPVLWAAEQMGVPPQACLMIGDTTVDMIAGKAAGAQAVGVLSGFGEREELLTSGADIILDSVAELPTALLHND